MTGQKQSQFTAKTTVDDTDYFPIFGNNTNEKILKSDLFLQIKDETQVFIYPTIDQLQSADLVADPDWPIYVRVEETDYRLYKITSLAADAGDIVMDNGTTATLQYEDRQLTVATFAALASTPAEVGQIVQTDGFSVAGRGANKYQAYAGTPSLIPGVQSLSSTAGFYWSIIFNGDLNVDDCGAIPTVGHDNITAISNAMNAVRYNRLGGIRLKFSYGIYEISAQLPRQTEPFKLVGVGTGDTGAPLLVTAGTTIKYVGSNITDPIFWIKGVYYGGWGIQDITFDCQNNIQGVSIDSCCGGRIENLTVRDDNNCGFDMRADSAMTCSFNTIINLNVDNYNNSAGVTCVRTTGSTVSGYNTCHNTFINTRIAHKGNRHGIVLADCDNVTFIMTYINTVSGAGKGVYCDSTAHAGFPGNNLFFHLQAGTGGYHQDAGCIHPGATIYGYALDNGEPEPVNLGSAQAGITWTSDNGRINGVRSIVYRDLADQSDFGSSSIAAGNTSVTLAVTAPNANYQIRPSFTSDPGGAYRWWISGRTTTQFVFNINAALGSTLFFDYKIERTA